MTFKEILLQIGGDATGAKNALRDASTKLAEWGRQKATAEAEADVGSAIRDIDLLLAAMAKVEHSRATAEVKVKTTAAMIELLAFRSALEAVDNDSRRSTSSLARLRRGLTDLGETLKPDSIHIGAFSFSLSRAGVAILFLAGTIVKSLVGALAALAASLTQAIGGLGALGVAALAATGPVAALAAAAFMRFSQASKATDDLRKAVMKLHTAMSAQRTAERTLADAQRQEIQTNQALAKARLDSARELNDNIRTALENVADAEQAVEDAQLSAMHAQLDLTQAREDAVRQLQDLRLAAEGAALGEKNAALQLQRARNELRELEANPGAPQMALREARLAVQQAELGVRESRRQSQRSQEDLAQEEAKGVNGSDIMVQAREALAAANRQVASTVRDLTDAQREENRALNEAKKRNEQVVAARHASQDAARATLDAQRKLALATERTAKAQRKVNQLEEKAKAFGPGSAARQLKQAAHEFKNAFAGITAEGSDSIFRGLTRALRNMLPLLQRLRDNFSRLGRAMGDAFAKLGKEFASPAWTRFFERMTDLATTLVPLGNKAFLRLAKILANIAEASAPFLTSAFGSIADSLGGVADSTSDIGRLRLVIGVMIDNLQVWIDLIKQVSRLWLNFAVAAAPAGKDLAQFLADAAEAMADFLASSEGKEAVTEFFADTLPVVESLIGVIGELLIAFVQFSQIVGPVLAPILEIIRRLLHSFNQILAVFQKLPDPVQTVFGALLLFAGPGKVIKGVWKAIKLVFGALAFGKWSSLITGIKGLFTGLKVAALGALTAIRGVATAILGRLAAAFATLAATGAGAAMRSIGARMLALAAEGGPIGILIAALILIIIYWDDVKNAISGAVDALKDWMSVQKLLNPDAFKSSLQIAINEINDLADEIKDQKGGKGKRLHDAAQEAGKNALESFGEGVKKAAERAGKTPALNLADPLASQLKAAGVGGHGGGKREVNMHNTFITSSGKMSDDREAVAAISRRLRQRGLSIA